MNCLYCYREIEEYLDPATYGETEVDYKPTACASCGDAITEAKGHLQLAAINLRMAQAASPVHSPHHKTITRSLDDLNQSLRNWAEV